MTNKVQKTNNTQIANTAQTANEMNMMADSPALACNFSLAGKTALVTGGTSGLGFAIAEAFLRQGASLAVCGRDTAKAEPLRALAAELGRPFAAFACDLSSSDAVSQMLDELEARFSSIDILVNSAGINRLIAAESYTDEDFYRVMDINLLSLHRLCREVGRRFMIPRRSGRILSLSSVKSMVGADANYIAYCTSKGAVNMYTKQLACEWGKYGITVNAIAPTFVRTPINSAQLDNPEFYQSLVTRIPLGRIGKSEDVAAAAVFLCSDAAAFITGQILFIDGGLTAMQ